jgi:hypothetical protein
MGKKVLRLIIIRNLAVFTRFGTIQSLMECQNKIQKRKERAEASLKSVRQRELLDNAKKGERKPHGKRQVATPSYAN